MAIRSDMPAAHAHEIASSRSNLVTTKTRYLMVYLTADDLVTDLDYVSD
ncbi:MAG TPA: hypothetical protein VGZ28_14475 [Terriglobales bacterium]|nr:hypothetical protein [Terriglobales bacterium]